MTPAEFLVVETAKAWRQARLDRTMPKASELLAALDALDAERAEQPANEMERTWGDVVAEDEIFSAKTGKWYPVISALRHGGQVAIMAKGLPKAIKRPARDPVRLRRSATGQAADLMMIVMSGPTGSAPAAEDTLKQEDGS